MRMWMINPVLLCDKHLLGEHGEIHKFRHVFVKKWSISGRISPVVQIQPKSMAKRHKELAEEMTKRKFNHNSPYVQPDISYLPKNERTAEVDKAISVRDLRIRCSDCKKIIQRLKINDVNETHK